MTSVALAFPGSLATPTGGYAYDREVLAALGGQDVDVQPIELPADFPFPSPSSTAEALRRLAAVEPRHLLMVDGLALGALPPDGLAPLAPRLVALIHHPLAMEEGLAPAARAHLATNERAVLALCRAVVTTSAVTARTLVSDYGVPESLITVAEPGVAAAEVSDRLGTRPVLLAIGSVIPRKAYSLLVSVLADLEDLDWTLTIIGSLDLDPTEVERVRGAISAHGLGERVTLRGAVSRADLDAAYLACDLIVHPALYEGYGMVLAEALRRGLPLICTTGGAAAETVPDGAGIKVPPGEAAPLRAALRHLLSDPEARRALAARARIAGQSLPTWDDTARRIAEALRRVSARQVAA